MFRDRKVVVVMIVDDASHDETSAIAETLGEIKAADLVDKALARVTGKKLKSMSARKMGYSTSEVGDMVAQFVADA